MDMRAPGRLQRMCTRRLMTLENCTQRECDHHTGSYTYELSARGWLRPLAPLRQDSPMGEALAALVHPVSALKNEQFDIGSPANVSPRECGPYTERRRPRIIKSIPAVLRDV